MSLYTQASDSIMASYLLRDNNDDSFKFPIRISNYSFKSDNTLLITLNTPEFTAKTNFMKEGSGFIILNSSELIYVTNWC